MFGNLLGGGGGGLLGTGMNLMLLRMPEVQTELQITDDQSQQINDLIQGIGDTMRTSMQGINFQDMMNASPEDRQKMFDDIRKKAETATNGMDEKVKKVLKPEQAKRLHELVLQRMGAAALTTPEVIKALDLSTEQVDQIKKIQTTAANSAFPAFDPNQSQEDRQAAMRAAMQSMHDRTKKVQEDSLKVLTDPQALEFANMCGKTFKFPAQQFGRGRNGPGAAQPNNQ
jgi:hypothetical protein